MVSSPPPGGVRRNTEIEEATNLYFIHPISGWLVPVFAKAGIHPNTVSIAGAAAGMLAAVAYYFHDTGSMVFVGLALMILWHILDGADGQLARLTGKVTPSGFVIDGICDYATFGAIYISIGLQLTPSWGAGAWLLVALAGASHAVQSAAFERQRASYIYWTSKVKAMTPAQLEKARAEEKADAPKSSTLRGFVAYYDVIQRPFLPIPLEVERRLRDEVLAGHADEVAALYRATYRPAVLMWSLLSANNRTMVIFITFLVGLPQGYPLFELVALNLILAALVGMNASLGRRLARWEPQHG
ncbi:MAG: CDP-alcohol phosphatidyltransferase family protein [Rhodospirillaceae bacterium]|nr:CDP-alcohol phosphatidyltransferase family protein [Rhodospirillaceae bacterium]